LNCCKIAILLSTFNGIAYLDQLFDSIIKSQTYSGDYTLFIRDDGSTDCTFDLIQEYASRYKQIELVDTSNRSNIGSVKSYFRLLQHARTREKFDLFFFCDQDDIWLPDKIDKIVSVFKLHDPAVPMLVHSDLTVVSKDGKIIARSFWSYQKIDPNRSSLNHLLVQNCVTGCSMAINQSLANHLDYVPTRAIMHDWWIALVASITGEIRYIRQSTMLYRQHDQNTVGAKKYAFRNALQKIKDKEAELNLIDQAQELLVGYGHILNINRKVVEEFVSLKSSGWCRKLRIIIQNKFYKNGFLRNLGWMIKKI